MTNYEMSKKELSIWAHLNEAEYYLNEGQIHRSRYYIQYARQILSGNETGDFEYDFLKKEK
ncbi:hypothetical protein [Carnobacterium divergens]|uniref:hypothetical protein n=1 Tax=Carnobacterium divergens TaxID=2748 RepID=UPI0039AEB6A9